MSSKVVITACALAACGLALAKLPPQDDATKAKAAETAARAAWQAKVDAYQLCKVQDRIAAQYRGKGGMVRTGASMPTSSGTAPALAGSGAASAGAGPSAPSAGPAPSSAAAAAAIMAAAPQPGASTAAGANAAPGALAPANPQAAAAAGQAGGTPVAGIAAAPTLPPCTEPGQFAYNPPSQTPLETSGAHSPAGNAATPPSVRPESAQMAPAGAATPQSKKP